MVMQAALPQIRPISDLRTRLNDIENLARESREPIIMTKNGTASLIVIDSDAIERAAELPELGQPFFDEDLDHQGYRRVLVKRYWIYYTYDAHTLTVRRVFHTMQDTDCYGFELLDD